VAFANTRYWRGSDPVRESLNGLADVLKWCGGAGTIDAPTLQQLATWGSRNSGEAARLFDETIAARETIYALLSAEAAGEAIGGRDIDELDRLLVAAPARTSLSALKTGAAWRLPPVAATTASLLAPVLWSAGDLLAGQRRQRLRMCANDKCRWLFIDDSKSGTRRWCSMSSCGNRAKAHRHYLKKTGAAAEGVD